MRAPSGARGLAGVVGPWNEGGNVAQPARKLAAKNGVSNVCMEMESCARALRTALGGELGE